MSLPVFYWIKINCLGWSFHNLQFVGLAPRWWSLCWCVLGHCVVETIISGVFPNRHQRTWPLQVFSCMKTDPWHLVWKTDIDTWWYYCSELGRMGGISVTMVLAQLILYKVSWISFHISKYLEVIFFCDDYKIPLKRLLQLHYGPKHTTKVITILVWDQQI